MYLSFYICQNVYIQQIYLRKLNQATLVQQKAEIQNSQTSEVIYIVRDLLWNLNLFY